MNPPYEYLDDPSGGTRYHPIRCTRIDIEELAAMRDQLWAEARDAFKAGELWYPTADGERGVLAGQQDDRARQDVWAEKIGAYLRKNICTTVTALDLLEGALKLDAKDHSRPTQTRVGIIMTQHFGWTRARRREGDRRWYEYSRPPAGPTSGPT